MKYSYTAYFNLDDDEQGCTVEVPALEIEYYIKPDKYTRKAIIKQAKQELADTLYLYELDGITPPADKESVETLGANYHEVLEIDTDKKNRYMRPVWKVEFE